MKYCSVSSGRHLDLAAEPAVGGVEGQDRPLAGLRPGPGGCRAGRRSGAAAAEATRPAGERRGVLDPDPADDDHGVVAQIASWRWRKTSQGRPERSMAAAG